jgi:hypothetical protein
VPLLQIVPSKGNEERLLLISFDADAGVTKGLDDRPAPERILFVLDQLGPDGGVDMLDGHGAVACDIGRFSCGRRV